MLSIRLIVALLFCLSVNGQNVINSYRFSTSCPVGFFTDNAATPAPCEVNSVANFVADTPAHWIITSDGDSQDGSFAAKFELDFDITSTSRVRITLTGLTNGGNYTITVQAKKSGVGNMRMQLNSASGWTLTQSTGFFTTSYAQYQLTGTTNSTAADIIFLSTLTGEVNDFMLIDNLTIEVAP